MTVDDVKAEFGAVVGGLLEYPYENIPPESRTKGQKEALGSARGWVESVLRSELHPLARTTEEFHNQTPGTCDAVRLRYPVRVGSNELEVQVSQTVFVLTFSFLPVAAPPSEWQLVNEEAMTRFARSVLQQPQRLDLQVTNRRNGAVLGRQAPREAAFSNEIDWVDTLMWWSDGQTVGFAALKRTGPDQAAKTSASPGPNQFWFRMFETPRAR
jgi:hypothetical protein